MLLTAVLLPAAEGGLTAFNPETGTTTQGETVEEALANLREATGTPSRDGILDFAHAPSRLRLLECSP